MLAAISGKAGNINIAISVVTLIELAHASQRKEKRQQFIQELLTALPIHPVIALPLSVDICFRDSVVFTSSTCWHTMPRSTQSFPLSHPNHGERKKVKDHTGIPVFDVDAVPSLLDWRI